VDSLGLNTTFTLDLTLAGSLTPRLVDGNTIEFSAAGDTVVLRYGDLVVTDAVGNRLPASLSLTPAHLSVQVDCTAAIYPLAVQARITAGPTEPAFSCPDQGVSESCANGLFGSAVASAGDVNNDGYDDVIIGAVFFDGGLGYQTGRAFVYLGTTEGLSTTVSWTADGDQAGCHFGQDVSTAGDVNNDGYSDVIVGARYYDSPESNEGAAFVYYGSATGLRRAR
jgi:hypothetical protein